MAFNLYWYSKSLANLLGGEVSGDSFAVDYLSDTVKVMLTTSSYAYNLETNETKADVTNEVAGTGYSAGGATLGTKTITVTVANSWSTTWAASTAYVVGDVVRPSAGNTHLYKCIIAGTSAGSAPTFPTVNGNTVADNTVTWAEAGRSITQLDAADVTWASSTITARYCVGYKDTGTASTSPLLFLGDFASDQTTNNGTFQITWASLGILVSFV